MSTISENNASQYRTQAVIGARVTTDPLYKVSTFVNKDPQASQVSRVAFAAPGTGNTLQVSITYLGVTSSASIVSTGTAATDMASLAEALNSNPDIRGTLEATAGASFVDLTALLPNQAFTVAATGGTPTVTTTTAAAAAGRIPFGRLIFAAGFSNQTTDPATQLGRLARLSALSAQIDNLEVDFNAGATYTVILTVDGAKDAVAVAANTDSATTAADIITAISGLSSLAALGLAASDGGAAVSGTGHFIDLTVPAGVDLTVDYSSDVADSFLSFATSKSASTSLQIAVAGVSEMAYDEEMTSTPGQSADYPPNAGMSVVSEGWMWVELDDGVIPTQGGAVWADLGSGDTAGRFYTEPGTDRRLIPGLSWLRGSRTGSNDNIGALSVSLDK